MFSAVLRVYLSILFWTSGKCWVSVFGLRNINYRKSKDLTNSKDNQGSILC